MEIKITKPVVDEIIHGKYEKEPAQKYWYKKETMTIEINDDVIVNLMVQAINKYKGDNNEILCKIKK